MAKTPSVGRSFAVYTVARIGLFILFAALIYLATSLFGHALNGLPLLFAALLLSAIASLFIFSRQREAIAAAAQQRRDAKDESAASRRARLDED